MRGKIIPAVITITMGLLTEAMIKMVRDRTADMIDSRFSREFMTLENTTPVNAGLRNHNDL